MGNGELVFVGDIHGEFDALSRLCAAEDTLFIAGDLLNFMDFADITKGILWHAFTPEELAEGLAEYAKGNFARVRQGIREVSTPGEPRYERVRPLIEETYDRLKESLPCPAYIIYGNDDYPDILKARLDGRARLVESSVIDVRDIKIGLVSGMPEGKGTMGLSGEVPRADFHRRIFSLGTVDIVVTHVPPEVPDIIYDTIARRDERASADLLDYIYRHEPTYSFFGHVHNPRLRDIKIGRTTAMNLGFFRKTRTVLRMNADTMKIREAHL